MIDAGLDDPARTVRYYAAFQLAGLGPAAGKRAIPVLRRIIEEEKDEDLVDRAKLYLIKLDPQSLSRLEPRVSAQADVGARRADGRMLRVRIFKEGFPRPKVTVNLPMTLAELLFKSLPEEAKRDLQRKGYDADHFWDQLKKLGPTEIIDIEGDAGEKIQIWIE